MNQKKVVYHLTIMFILLLSFPVLSQWNYYVNDHLGNTRVVLDEDGDVKEYYDYYPFGMTMRDNITGSEKARVTFTGKEEDEELGLKWHYFGARYYDASIGRWLSVDPLAEKHPDFSPYNYVLNNPLILVDPDGKQISYDIITRQRQVRVIKGENSKEEYLAQTRADGGAAVIALGVLALSAYAPQLGVSFLANALRLNQTAISVIEVVGENPEGHVVGEFFEKGFKIGDDVIDVLAETVVEGKTLHLKDIAVFPRDSEVLEIGKKSVIEIRKLIAKQAKKLGFKKLRITGKRISGAKPNKLIDVTIDLTKDLE